MIAIISPAKNMREDEMWKNIVKNEMISYPSLHEETNHILSELKKYSVEEIARLMRISEKLAELNFERFKNMEFLKGNKEDINEEKTPAVFAYDGMQYKYIEVEKMSYDEIEFMNSHLRIISGFYGVLKPLDLIDEYRLEMQTKLEVDEFKNLYSFWNNKIYNEIINGLEGSEIILNLASKEYSKTIEKYISGKNSDKKYKFITCTFKVNKGGKMRVDSTSSKKSRGSMVKFIAENKIDTIEEVKKFSFDGFKYSEEESSEGELVFVKNI